VINSLFGNWRNILIYTGIWVFIACIHIFVLTHIQKFPFDIALTESIVSNFLFACFGLALWVSIIYSNIENKSILIKIINHALLCIIFLGICLGIEYLILNSAFKDNSDYIKFLTASIPQRIGNGFLLFGLIIIVYYLMIYYQNFREKTIRESELKSFVKESELSSLKSQINPHFLFNSLNSISSLTLIKPEKAREMVIKLSDFLRYSISRHEEQLTSLKEELENVNRYLDIEKIRFGRRLRVVLNISEQCQDRKLPGLILQPLIENAIKYGVYESVDESVLEIATSCDAKVLIVIIKNSYDPDFITKKGEGIGLKNIRNRLAIMYNNDNLMQISKSNNIFEVTITFPQKI
jgi:two-component system LytT family sensor kinase